eukprot:GEMP01054641.1.p1 GENE.GEMP01054641.1~~GEMP01054641.1.p1  ORF type:complete len:196 (+),score=28.36 GEMP01054641.1:381-968(+)
MNYGSYAMSRMLGKTLDVLTIENTKFNTLQDLVGAASLQITALGYNCVQYHGDATLDHVCPGSFNCPEDETTMTDGGIGIVDLENAECPATSLAFLYWFAVCIMFAVWLTVTVKCTMASGVSWMEIDIVANSAQKETIQQSMVIRDSKLSSRMSSQQTRTRHRKRSNETMNKAFPIQNGPIGFTWILQAIRVVHF